jgi:peptidyl-tRNA hydrolase, PTH1 family
MKLFFGLGNPGKEYENTRHNLGQMVINNFLSKNYPNETKNIHAEKNLNSWIFKTQQAIYATSNLYMNESGLSIKKISDYYKISPENIYIIHDDLDLPIGEWRLQFDRGAAGHNGVKSTIENLGTQAFWRIRIGIGHPPENIPVEDYVLKPFTSDEKTIINSLIKELTFDKFL